MSARQPGLGATVAVATLLLAAAANAAEPRRICGGLPTDALSVEGKPSTLAVVFVGTAGYGLHDGGAASPFLRYFPLTPAAGSSCASPSGPAAPVAASLGSQAIVAGDFNGDGIPDAASVAVSPGRLSVFLGDSTGALNAGASYAIGAKPVSVVAADFNGDGKLDLAVANAGIVSAGDPGFVAILLGNGDGTFQTPARYTVGAAPVSLAVADFNGDGHLDLVVANSQSLSLSILLGVGDATFGRSTDYLVDEGPFSVVAADFNADGKIDVAVSNSLTASISVMLGNGDGTFAGNIGIPVADGPGFLASADFNGDGKPDLAVLFQATNTLSILLGTGGGLFGRAVDYVVGASPSSLALVDLDGDGALDILAPDPGSRGILILKGRPDGTFDAAPLYAAGAAPAAVAIADFNGDGNLDLIAPNQASGDISILLGNGDGSFRAPARIALTDPAAFPRPTAAGVGDFNGDGRPDLAVAIGSPLDRVTILLGRGNGTFQQGGNYPTGPEPGSVLVADFNGDGILDLATANSNQVSNSDFGSLTVLLGNGAGTFRPPVAYDAGVRPYAVVAGDFNGDGIVDLVVGANGDLRTKLPATIAIFIGQGDGTFQPAQYAIVGDNPPTAAQSGSIAVGDLNGDGYLDLVVTNSSALVILTGGGDGTFQQAAYAIDSGARSVAIGDMDGDGKPDLVIAHSDSDMSYMLGKGDGTFQPEVHFPGGVTPIGAAIGDFDGDGSLDLAVADSAPSGALAILLNRLRSPR